MSVEFYVKYLLSWTERPAGHLDDYEAAQKRVLTMFEQWQMPSSIRILQFLKRVSDFGGYAVIECADPAEIHRLTTAFAMFQYRVEPVLDLADAVVAEMDAVRWRDTLKR
jgi:hypothetical protein